MVDMVRLAAVLVALANAPSWLPVWLPEWVASEAFVVAAVGVLCLVVGSALLSHARGG